MQELTTGKHQSISTIPKANFEEAALQSKRNATPRKVVRHTIARRSSAASATRGIAAQIRAEESPHHGMGGDRPSLGSLEDAATGTDGSQQLSQGEPRVYGCCCGQKPQSRFLDLVALCHQRYIIKFKIVKDRPDLSPSFSSSRW